MRRAICWRFLPCFFSTVKPWATIAAPLSGPREGGCSPIHAAQPCAVPTKVGLRYPLGLARASRRAGRWDLDRGPSFFDFAAIDRAMEILYLLIPVSLLFVVVIAAAFFWSVRSGQYDDLEGPAHRILMDDDDTRRVGREGNARKQKG